VLSRDPAYIERFADAGFQSGMYADPTPRPPLRHEGLFSLWMSKLMAAYGVPGSELPEYLPNGIGLAGLNR
jgi:hypothetical protein